MGGFPTAPSHGRLWHLPCLVCHGPWHAISCYRTLKYGTLADQVGDLWLPEDPEGGLDDDEKLGMAALVNPRSYLDIVYECSEWYVYIMIYLYYYFVVCIFMCIYILYAFVALSFSIFKCWYIHVYSTESYLYWLLIYVLVFLIGRVLISEYNKCKGPDHVTKLIGSTWKTCVSGEGG